VRIRPTSPLSFRNRPATFATCAPRVTTSRSLATIWFTAGRKRLERRTLSSVQPIEHCSVWWSLRRMHGRRQPHQPPPTRPRATRALRGMQSARTPRYCHGFSQTCSVRLESASVSSRRRKVQERAAAAARRNSASTRPARAAGSRPRTSNTATVLRQLAQNPAIGSRTIHRCDRSGHSTPSLHSFVLSLQRAHQASASYRTARMIRHHQSSPARGRRFVAFFGELSRSGPSYAQQLAAGPCGSLNQPSSSARVFAIFPPTVWQWTSINGQPPKLCAIAQVPRATPSAVTISHARHSAASSSDPVCLTSEACPKVCRKVRRR